MKEKLQKIRSSIDGIDREIIELLEKRMGFVEKVAELKHSNTSISYIRADREAEMLKSLLRTTNKLPKQIIIQMWRLIISMSLQQECEFVIHAHCAEEKKEYLKRLVREYFSTLTDLVYEDQVKVPESPQSLVACLCHDKRQYEFLLKNQQFKIFTRLPDLSSKQGLFELSDVNVMAIIEPELIAYDRVICAVSFGLADPSWPLIVDEVVCEEKKYTICDISKEDFYSQQSPENNRRIEFLGGYVESFA